MENRKHYVPSEIYTGLWSTIWILVLSAPLIYYQAHQAKDETLGILAAVTISLVPLLSTILHRLWCLFYRGSAKNTRSIAPEATAYTFLLIAVTCLYFLQEWQEKEHYTRHILILWMVVGVVAAILGIGLKKWRDPKTLLFLSLFIACAIFQTWRGLNDPQLGKAGAALGLMMVVGLGLGYFLYHSINHILIRARRLWHDLAVYRWEFATFVSGYLIIIYIFAGLNAMLWAIDANSLNMSASLGARQPNFGDFLYSSLLTVATLGGEVKPVSLLAKVSTASEILVGIFWITVVFSRLSNYAIKHPQDRDGPAQLCN